MILWVLLPCALIGGWWTIIAAAVVWPWVVAVRGAVDGSCTGTCIASSSLLAALNAGAGVLLHKAIAYGIRMARDRSSGSAREP